MNPKISIIIPTKNGASTLADVLDRVFSLEYNGRFEVIVIDSGSTDTTTQIAKRYPLRLYEILPEEFSHGGTRNMGAELSGGEFLVFLTQDAYPPDENWLSYLLQGFDKDNVAAIFGRQIPQGTSPIEEFYLNFVYPDQGIRKERPAGKDCLLRDIFFSNVNSAIRKSIWERFRFNQELIMSEDQEWSKRVLEAGYTIIYEPLAAVYHTHNYDPVLIFKRNFDSGISLRGLVYAGVEKIIQQEFEYLFQELKYMLKKKAYRWLLLLPIYELSRFSGFTLGFNHRFIPYMIKRRLSLNANYWNSLVYKGKKRTS